MASIAYDKSLRVPGRKLSSLSGIFGIRTEEEPKHYVIRKEEEKQIRKYQPMLIAQTWSRGDLVEATTRSFNRLFSFFMGHNSEKEVLPMTTPVFRARGEKLSMVSSYEEGKMYEGWIMAFVLPIRSRIESLPTPFTSKIEFVEVPSLIVASIRYNGKNTEEKINAKTEELINWVKSLKGFNIASDPRIAEYDGPYVIPYFRRNEIQVTLIDQNRMNKTH